MTRIALVELAHARAGDKGDSSILFLAPYELDDFNSMRASLTTGQVANHFGVATESMVTINASPHLAAFSIVIRHRLAGGVTRSPSIDPHGKTLSAHLLEMVIEWPERNPT
jgi:hypothetical protein